MPRVARKHIDTPTSYTPLAAPARPLRARRRHPISRLPSEILAQILAQVPWRRARAVCRTWAALRPAPEGVAMQAEATRALARMAWRAHETAMGEIYAMRHKPGTAWLMDAQRQALSQELCLAFGGTPPQSATALRRALGGNYVIWVHPSHKRQEIQDLRMQCFVLFCDPLAGAHIPISLGAPVQRTSARAAGALGQVTTRDKQVVYALYRMLPGYTLLELLNDLPKLFRGRVNYGGDVCARLLAGEFCLFRNM